MEEKPLCNITTEDGVIKFADIQDGGAYADCQFDLSKDINLHIDIPQPVNKVVSADTTTVAEILAPKESATVASVIVPTKEVHIPPKPPVGLLESAPMALAAVSGIVGSAAGLFVNNLIKGQLKKLIRPKKAGEAKQEEEKAVDCKTHNLQCNTRSSQFSADIYSLKSRVSSLEAENRKEDGVSFSSGSSLEELIERIEKLEKLNKKRSKT